MPLRCAHHASFMPIGERDFPDGRIFLVQHSIATLLLSSVLTRGKNNRTKKETLAELRTWAVEAMSRFQPVMEKHVQEITEKSTS